jgi:hypothetical protein
MIRAFFIAMAFAAIVLTAGAQPLPQPKVGAACPSGYRDSGGYCAPTSDRAPVAEDRAMPVELDAERRLLHRDAKALTLRSLG